MSLWQRLEKRGREELDLNEHWHLYAADLDGTKVGYADLKFAQKKFDKYATEQTVPGSVKYHDLR